MEDFPAGHVMLASASAGAIVVLPPALLAIVTAPSQILTTITVAPFILLFAVPIGFFISFIPNMAGTAALRWLGGRYRIARHPLAWLASGFAIACLMSAGFFDSIGIGNAALGVVGAACAGICRWGTVWTD